jgi:hypothetical protein
VGEDVVKAKPFRLSPVAPADPVSATRTVPNVRTILYDERRCPKALLVASEVRLVPRAHEEGHSFGQQLLMQPPLVDSFDGQLREVARLGEREVRRPAVRGCAIPVRVLDWSRKAIELAKFEDENLLVATAAGGPCRGKVAAPPRACGEHRGNPFDTPALRWRRGGVEREPPRGSQARNVAQWHEVETLSSVPRDALDERLSGYDPDEREFVSQL